MCGISGLLAASTLREEDIAVVGQMNQRLIHRGPDSDGMVVADPVVLAMRRLSIIDLAGGQQPIFNETKDIAIVCNGEIYNHAELRRDLQGRGHQFASRSDVETIVHAYEEYGLDCLAQLRGMFAFALWDGPRQRLLLARDRMGEKPFYLYRDSDQNLWFSSELQSLAVAMPRQRLTPEAFNLFLAFQYVPEPVAPLEGVQILPAGHALVIESGNRNAAPFPYWEMAQATADPTHPIDVVKHSLDEACRLMGTADVPVAVALSGGIDSSLVAAVTARHYPEQLHAFTIGYDSRPATDERSVAAALAQQLNIGFTEVELSHRAVVDDFPTLVAAMDTPIGDIAAYGYYAVSQAARQAGYPVLLSGMGGDEFFWGYEWVREAMTRNEAILAGQPQAVPFWHRWRGKKPVDQPDFFGVHDALCQGNTWARALMPSSVCDRLADTFWLDKNSLDLTQPLHIAVPSLLNRTWLRSNCLALVDRLSMHHSVEVRLPLLDPVLVDRVTGMRNAGLQDWHQPHKHLLVEAMQNVIPPEVLARKKQGFTPPTHEWMQSIVNRYSALIHRGSLVHQGLIEESQSALKPGRFDLFFMYKLTLLECWSRLHLDRQAPETLSHQAAV
ncbi:asparagine synthase (glutamine-hydrolyzing) [Nodosilinea sp. LEGE 07088]|uniref:asparagine synthase (glutamine-hydrolyzing) n=1 Tax=Nodosilinea sp. LEGE 07088 TaxID=2777968 RepID=UPI00187F46A0|nr:asparagine synthase (glutamine-hydrolyzing) [Nodosilinea sp. LEGE 07088]MBE9139846.1 asparagine synthase (glutamine-hydrolyzing) [Nodosilinea sp. LEGE 07088]